MTARSETFDEGNAAAMTSVVPPSHHNNSQSPDASSKKQSITMSTENESDNEDNASILNEMPVSTFKPSPFRTSYTIKMKSASAITNDCDDNKVKEIINSFQQIKSSGSGINHFLVTDLNHSKHISSSRKIVDSHTTYRRDLELEITDLKLKLAEAQERADTLQNEFNKVSFDSDVYQAKMDEVIEKYDVMKKHSDELGAVVTHLQENVKEASDTKNKLQEKLDRTTVECKSLMKKNKLLRQENRKLQRELKEAGHDLEGRGMENQGLKSENDWLKKQLHNSYNSGFGHEQISDLGESSDDEKVVTGIRELLSFPSSSRRSSRKSSTRSRSRPIDYNDEDDDELIGEYKGCSVWEQDEQNASQSRKGLFSPIPLKLNSFSLDLSSVTPPRSKDRGLKAPQSQLESNNEQQQKIPSKWNWWSPFGGGESESKLKMDAHGASIHESEYSSEDFLQYPPKPSRPIHVKGTPQLFDNSAKVLVPKRLNQRM